MAPPADFLERVDKPPVISGPHKLYNGSFILEFLQDDDPALDSSVIMRGTYIAKHALSRLGKAHPQVPPLHIHFCQAESFKVLSGRLGSTMFYECKDRIFTPADDTYEIKPWTPHRFWPDPNYEDEDTVALFWAHPKDVASGVMDAAFFERLIVGVSEAYEKSQMPDLLEVYMINSETASSLIMFPTAWWLGPLRWWIPYAFQANLATLAKLLGYKIVPHDAWKDMQKKIS